MKNKKNVSRTLAALSVILLVTSVALSIWVAGLNKTIRERLSGQRWSAPTDFYAAPEKFMKGQSQASRTLTETLSRLDYISRPSNLRMLRPGEFSVWSGEECRERMTAGVAAEVRSCWAIAPRPRNDMLKPDERIAALRPLQVLALNGDDIVYEVYEGNPPVPMAVVELEPELFAQFYGGQPVLRQIVHLGDVPPSLLNAIIAIEDSDFLNHAGISVTGIARAAYRNFKHGGVSEGGSTLTQQLIKNYFLTSERTFKRKITEVAMALLLESRFTKDDILETYINEVYLGQAGPFEIHGVATAAGYYFKKRVSDLTLAESALLGGLIQSPNRLNPFKHPQKTMVRRTTVLKRMMDLKLISQSEFNEAGLESLPAEGGQLLRDQAPFFVDAVHGQLKQLGIEETAGLRVYTTLNVRAQKAATEAVITGLRGLEQKYDFIQKTEQRIGARIQAALVSADPTNGFVEAVVGGADYKSTQLNRAVQSRRQVGSVFKPFVYLAAFTSVDSDGVSYTPLSSVLDAPFTVTYDKRQWSPQNYDNVYLGNVTLYQALEHSLNAATVKVALQVGLQKVADTAKKAGIQSALPPLPSLALGAVDLSPLEVVQAFSTMTRRGELNPLTFVYQVTDGTGKTLYQFTPSHLQALDPIATSQTVSLMEGVLERGTGKSVRALGFTHPAAGKTGTTSDTKDAWFAGFTPLHTAVVWIGYDQPEKTGLTGALAAIPVWTAYMKSYASRHPPLDFAVPDGAVKVTVDPDSMMVASEKCSHRVPLVFRSGTQPTAKCWLPH